MLFEFYCVDEAFTRLVSHIHKNDYGLAKSPSRVGDVIRFTNPVMVTFTKPRNRVMFNTERDCNPFFHLYEAIWMLAGREDVAPLSYYNSRMVEFSDNGKTLHGAYGYRWRNYFGYDQLDWIVEELIANPSSRRCVLQMWDGGRTRLEPILDEFGDAIDYVNEPVEQTGDLYVATHGGKDVPCNTNAYFEISEGRLNMTVCNRSNDLVWGMLGANVVHFSILQEVLAARIGVPMGRYHQFTNNLHVYTSRFQPERWLMTQGEATLRNLESNGLIPYAIGDISAEEAERFMDSFDYVFSNSWLEGTAKQACIAFRYHKKRDYVSALKAAKEIICPHWSVACSNWLLSRAERFSPVKVKNETAGTNQS